MKKITSSVIAAFTVSTMTFAGGDIAPVEPVVETPAVVETPGNFYVGLGYSSVERTDNWNDSQYLEKYEANAVSLILGYSFNEYIAIEGRYMTDIGNSDITENGDTFSDDIGFSDIAVYVKPMLPVTDDFTLYGLLGYGKSTHHWPGYSDITANGLQYGAGVSYALNENFSLFADYVVLAEENGPKDIDGYAVTDIEGNAITFGVTYKF